MAQIFTELALIMVIVFILALIANKIKQPLLVSYIITGVLAGPFFLDLLGAPGDFEAFAHIGVAFLLFIVGLHLNVKLIKEVGVVALITGIGQILFTTLIGYGLARVLGIDHLIAVIISLAFAFSSTIIVVKLLSDNGDIDKLYGKIAIGFLLVQDFIAVFALMFIGSLVNVNATTSMSVVLTQTLLKGIAAFIGVIIVGKIINKTVLKHVAKTKELLFIFVIAWCFGVAVLFGTIGFSIEIGALIAGVLLASSPYQHEFSARIKPLRDFFIVLFFVFLGTQLIPVTDGVTSLALAWQGIQPLLGKAIILSLFVLIGNPLIVIILSLTQGYSARTSFHMGIIISQISEFSLIIALLAKEADILTASHVSLVTLVAIITITTSAYLIRYADPLFKKVRPLLKRFERKKIRDNSTIITQHDYNIILFGFNRIGHGLLNSIVRSDKKFIVVEHDPRIVRKLQRKKIPVVMGDAGNPDFLDELEFHHTTLVISTIPDIEANAVIMQTVNETHDHATVILTAHNNEDALELYEKGADYVIIPHFLGGSYTSTLIENYHNKPEQFLKEKIKHINELHKRQIFDHDSLHEKQVKKYAKKPVKKK